MRSGVATIESVGLADLEVAWQIGLSWKDQDFSIIDRTSFAVMRRLGLERAASLDEYFAIFRYGPQRRQAFTIVR
jgi:predicted nucleic acid-binding protein